MENQIYVTSLYDYYKGLLTNKQQEYFEDYYFDNLTMEEIADNNGVSKNAVSKSLIEVKDKLEEYENILKLYHNKQRILELLEQEEIDKIIDLI